MAKAKIRYECSGCGAIHNSWSGKCSTCGEWNTIQQQLDVASADISKGGRSLKASVISEVAKKSADVKRISSEDPQLDTVLGGGFVPGSVLLLAGQPGIGKSTILMQIAGAVSEKVSVLYVSGEESAHQVASRASRLKAVNDDLKLASSNSCPRNPPTRRPLPGNDRMARLKKGPFP